MGRAFYKKTDNANFHPDTSIEQAIKLVESLLKLNEIKLIKNIDANIEIYGNSNSLAQVVLSIIQNTIDIVRTSSVQNPFISIKLHSTQDSIILTIWDNAGGIKVVPIDDIFKPFHSNQKRPSTGIGLYMSKLLIENQFHGTITASNVDNGAAFSIQLPYYVHII